MGGFMSVKSIFAAVAVTALSILPGVSSALTYDQLSSKPGFVTPGVIFGSGNANGSFTLATAGDLELGLRAKLRYDENSQPQNETSFDGVDTYTFDPTLSVVPANRAVFSFEWSINSDVDGGEDKLSTYDYLLSVSGPGFTTFSFDPSFKGYFGTNATSVPPVLSEATDVTGALRDANTVVQNSQNLGFFGLAGVLDPAASGQFTFVMSAFEKGTDTVVASVTANVNVSPVPVPAALPLLASGVAVFAWLRRRQLRAA